MVDGCLHYFSRCCLNAAFGVYPEGQAEAAIGSLKTCLVLWLVCAVMTMLLSDSRR